MKTAFFFILLFFVAAQAQTYLNIGSTSTPLSDISKITFSGSDINFYLTNNTVVTKPLSEMTSWTMDASGSGTPLPVELVSFTARIKQGEVILKWSTATEVNNYGFEVQKLKVKSEELRVRNGNERWETVGYVEGSGNSNSPKQYSFADSVTGQGKIYYRLKQIDTDGKFTYSSEVSVNLGAPTSYALRQNYPNPFNPSTTISYALPEDGKVSIVVYNALGQEVETLVNEYRAAGEYEAVFNARAFSSGFYICRLRGAGFTGSIKMLLIK